MRQFHAHCVCVVGKTTVCRIFSCQISLVVGRWPTRRIRDVGPRGTLDPTPPLSSRPLALSAASKSVSRSLVGSYAPRRSHARREIQHPTPQLFRSIQLLQKRKSFKDRRTSVASRGVGAPGDPAKPSGLRKRNKVENTGLEPVTSWMQTRRSPS